MNTATSHGSSGPVKSAAVELRRDRPAGLGGRVGPGAGPDHPGHQHRDGTEAHRQHQRRHARSVPGPRPAPSAGGGRRREVQLAVARRDADRGGGAGPAGPEQHALGRQWPVAEDLDGHPLGGDELVRGGSAGARRRAAVKVASAPRARTWPSTIAPSCTSTGEPPGLATTIHSASSPATVPPAAKIHRSEISGDPGEMATSDESSGSVVKSTRSATIGTSLREVTTAAWSTWVGIRSSSSRSTTAHDRGFTVTAKRVDLTVLARIDEGDGHLHLGLVVTRVVDDEPLVEAFGLPAEREHPRLGGRGTPRVTARPFGLNASASTSSSVLPAPSPAVGLDAVDDDPAGSGHDRRRDLRLGVDGDRGRDHGPGRHLQALERARGPSEPTVEGEGDVDRGRLGERVEQHEHVGGVEGRRTRGEVPLVRGRRSARSGVDPVGPRTTCSTTISPPRNSTRADAYGAATRSTSSTRTWPRAGTSSRTVSGLPSLGYAVIEPVVGRSVGLYTTTVWLAAPSSSAVPPAQYQVDASASSPAAVGIIRLRALVASACADASSRGASSASPWSDEQRRRRAGPGSRAGPASAGSRRSLRGRGLVPGRPVDCRSPRRGEVRRTQTIAASQRRTWAPSRTAYQAGDPWVSAGVAGVLDREPLRPPVRRRALAVGRRNRLELPARRRPLGQQERATAGRCAPPRWCGRCRSRSAATNARDLVGRGVRGAVTDARAVRRERDHPAIGGVAVDDQRHVALDRREVELLGERARGGSRAAGARRPSRRTARCGSAPRRSARPSGRAGGRAGSCAARPRGAARRPGRSALTGSGAAHRPSRVGRPSVVANVSRSS